MRLGVDSGYFLTKSSKEMIYNSGLKEHNAVPVAADELEPKSIFISENQICNAVMKKEILYADTASISKIAETESHEYVKNILRQLQERDFDLRVPTLIIGGGAALIMDLLKKYNINIIDCLDVFANAKAYEALLDRETD